MSGFDIAAIILAVVVTPLIVLLVMLGGNIKIGNITIGNPIGRMADSILHRNDRSRRPQHEPEPSGQESSPYRNLESFHAITTVIAVTTEDGKLVDATLKEASIRAEFFYGKGPGAAEEHLNGKKGEELINLLREFMDHEDYEAFIEDQVALFKDYTDGAAAYAKIPVIFNDNHPEYGRRAFLPVIVSRGKVMELENNLAERYMQIAYLDMEYFTEPVQRYREKKEGNYIPKYTPSQKNLLIINRQLRQPFLYDCFHACHPLGQVKEPIGSLTLAM